jgi:hypothetical protein
VKVTALGCFAQGHKHGRRTRTRANNRVGDTGAQPLVHQHPGEGGLHIVGRKGRHWGKITEWPRITE